MSDQYLWDRSGPPDPEVQRLEEALAPLRYRHRAELMRARSERPRIWQAAAAAAIIAAVALWQFRSIPVQHTSWQVARTEGAARLDESAAAVSAAVKAGQVVRTESNGEVTLLADEVGKVDLGPDSELRAANNRRLTLNRGSLHAFIWARPREFVVDTPSARAVDLGCEYTINVEPSGDGLLKVKMGWVAFQFDNHESFIPAGAECVTRKKGGPGIPYYTDASAPFRTALAGLERGERRLPELLASARPEDGLTLWHLLTLVAEGDRGAVYDRFRELVTLPAGVTRTGVLRNDPAMIDQCWNALNLENTGWWRGWERKW
jgi:hypothetical protein